MKIKQKQLFDILENIVIENKKEINNFHKYADKKDIKDIGFEGWLQFELIARLTEKNIDVDHRLKDADLHFKDREDIELRATTSFHPCYVLDGLIYHESQSPVLFFSGYVKKYSKINLPENYNDKKYVLESFNNYLKDKRKSDLKYNSICLEYKVIQLEKDKLCIIGFLSGSKELISKTI